MHDTLKSFPYSQKVPIDSLESLSLFAARFSRVIAPPDVIALHGGMGAGKTTLVAALGKALGLKESVASPTFVLAHEYTSGIFPVFHADLYRLGPDGADAFCDEIFSVIDEGRSLLLVEWASYAPSLAPEITISLTISPLAGFSSDAAPEGCAEEARLTQQRLIVLESERPLSLGGGD